MNNYKIPHEFKQYITDEFIATLSAEYKKIFNKRIEYDIMVRGWCGELSTAGGHSALINTCNILELNDLLNYYNGLPWYDSDIFDSEIERMIYDIYYKQYK